MRLRIRVEVRKAFFDLLLAQEELRIHDQHVDIAHQAIEAARIKYMVGKVPQQDVLKAQLAMTRLEEHMIRFERDAEVARIRMNTLLGRDPAAPIRVRATSGSAPICRPASNWSNCRSSRALTSRKRRQQRRRAARSNRSPTKPLCPTSTSPVDTC